MGAKLSKRVRLAVFIVALGCIVYGISMANRVVNVPMSHSGIEGFHLCSAAYYFGFGSDSNCGVPPVALLIPFMFVLVGLFLLASAISGNF